MLILYLHRTAVPISELEPVGGLAAELVATEGPAVLRLHVKFILAFITEKDQNAQRFTYLCNALQWLCLKLIKWKSLDLSCTHVIQSMNKQISMTEDLHWDIGQLGCPSNS